MPQAAPSQPHTPARAERGMGAISPQQLGVSTHTTVLGEPREDVGSREGACPDPSAWQHWEDPFPVSETNRECQRHMRQLYQEL